MDREDLTHVWPDRPILTPNPIRGAVSCDPSTRRPSAVLGRISGQPAKNPTVLVESSVRLASWADFAPKSDRFGASFGPSRPSKITLPLRRGADFCFFDLSRSFGPSDCLLDPVLGPLGPVLGPVLGLLGLSWAVLGVGPGAPRASKKLGEAPWSCLGPWSGSLGPFGDRFEAPGHPFGPHFGALDPPFGHLKEVNRFPGGQHRLSSRSTLQESRLSSFSTLNQRRLSSLSTVKQRRLSSFSTLNQCRLSFFFIQNQLYTFYCFDIIYNIINFCFIF